MLRRSRLRRSRSSSLGMTAPGTTSLPLVRAFGAWNRLAVPAGEREGPEPRVDKRDDAEHDQRVSRQPTAEREDQPQGGQPQRSGQLAAPHRAVTPGLEDQLAREPFVGVERRKDRVHAASLQAAQVPLLQSRHARSYPWKFATGEGYLPLLLRFGLEVLARVPAPDGLAAVGLAGFALAAAGLAALGLGAGLTLAAWRDAGFGLGFGFASALTGAGAAGASAAATSSAASACAGATDMVLERVRWQV